MKITVPVSFEGGVTVEMQDDLPKSTAQVLAKKLALAYIMATVDNPDPPLDRAMEQFLRDRGPIGRSTAILAFENAKVEFAGGMWRIKI